ncbi:inactive CLIP domain-containing serine protease A8-like [Drosophila montana]|uniref:inactive CLIP domain-containing serine protease A8-like n=1 Tax=Drosophila montana TaxID=40370 RepID=UPI00313D9825
MLLSRAWLCCFLSCICLLEAHGQEDEHFNQMQGNGVNDATGNMISSTETTTEVNEDDMKRQEDSFENLVNNNNAIDNINSSTKSKAEVTTEDNMKRQDNNNITTPLQLYKEALKGEIFNITHKYINISISKKVNTKIDETFELIERTLLAQAKTTTPATTTTTTTTPRPIPKCGENMTIRSVKRWNCITQSKQEEKYIINLNEEEDNKLHYLEICCSDSDIRNVTLPSHSVEKDPRCGLTNPKGVYFTIEGNVRGEANFGEYPWIVGIFTNLSKYRVGGSLIAPRVVLSTANLLNNVEGFKVRAGEWDMATENEILPYQERSAAIVPNPNYSLEAFINNIALLILNATFSPVVHIRPICLPEGGIFDYKNCIVAGWNRYSSNGRSIVASMRFSVTKCADGTHDSFLCVTGNSRHLKYSIGSALACPKVNESPNRFYQIGTWSHGRTTDSKFTNVEKFSAWIHNEIDKVN